MQVCARASWHFSVPSPSYSVRPRLLRHLAIHVVSEGTHEGLSNLRHSAPIKSRINIIAFDLTPAVEPAALQSVGVQIVQDANVDVALERVTPMARSIILTEFLDLFICVNGRLSAPLRCHV